jgi:hypothetical protein
MKKLFNDFVDFRHLTHVTKAGSESVNGFVLNLHYETMNYKAHALLKSSKKKRSDNLYYEYLVGIMLWKQQTFNGLGQDSKGQDKMQLRCIDSQLTSD